MGEVDGVLDDVHLVFHGREDVDRGIGDEDGAIEARHVHDEAVADAPAGAQAGGALDHGAHQFVSVQAALHQQFGAAFAYQLHRRLGRRHAVRRIDQLVTGNVQLRLRRHSFDFGARADQNRLQYPQFGCLDGAAQRAFVAGMGHGGRGGGKFLAAGDQAFVLLVLAFHELTP